MKGSNVALKIFAILAAFMIYYGFYSRLKRVVSANTRVDEIIIRDTLEFRVDSVKWWIIDIRVEHRPFTLVQYCEFFKRHHRKLVPFLVSFESNRRIKTIKCSKVTFFCQFF